MNKVPSRTLKRGGGSPRFFVKLDFDAVDQQTRAYDRTIEGVLDCGTATHMFGQFLAQFCQITMLKTIFQNLAAEFHS